MYLLYTSWWQIVDEISRLHAEPVLASIPVKCIRQVVYFNLIYWEQGKRQCF